MDRHWALYVRVSTRQQVDGFSLADQRDKLIAYAKSQCWEWTVFDDPGVSGGRLADRPGLSALLEAVDRGEIHGVMVVDESRLARDELVAAQIRDKFKRAGVLLATPTRGVLNLNEPTEKFMASVIAAAHVFDQDLRRSKTMSGLKKTAESGYWPGGPAPYGYKLVPSDDGKHTVLALNDEEANVLHLVADLIVRKGYTTYSASAHLNAIGIRTRRGSPWRHENLSGHIRKRHTTGVFLYDPKVLSIPIRIPPVFTEDQWNALQKAVKGKPRPNRKNRTYPLTGRGRVHLTCACGGNFFGYSDRSSKKDPMYECSGNSPTFGDERCPHHPRTTKARALDHSVWDVVIEALTDSGYLEQLATAHIADIVAEAPATVTGLRKRLGQLRSEETVLVRRMAVDPTHYAATERALDEVASERITVEKELERLHQNQKGVLAVESIPQAVQRLSEVAQARLANPTIELMADVFDLLDIDLIRIEGRTFDGVARIPLPDMSTEGEVWEGEPPAHEPRQR